MFILRDANIEAPIAGFPHMVRKRRRSDNDAICAKTRAITSEDLHINVLTVQDLRPSHGCTYFSLQANTVAIQSCGPSIGVGVGLVPWRLNHTITVARNGF